MNPKPYQLYRHFKGGVYITIGVSTHTESGEPLVVYHPVGRPDELWSRPLAMFNETVMHEGKEVPRFQEIQ